jgi:hypothetical protein
MIFIIDRDDVLTWVRETLPHDSEDAEDFDVEGITDDVVARWDILGRRDVSHIPSSARQLGQFIDSIVGEDEHEGYWDIVERHALPESAES